MVDMIRVESSNIHSVGWDDAKSELHIRFIRKRPDGNEPGDTWIYSRRVDDGTPMSGVPINRAMFTGICEAVSPGRFFHQFIKGIYVSRKPEDA